MRVVVRSTPSAVSVGTSGPATGSPYPSAVAGDAAAGSHSSASVTVTAATAPPPDTTPPTVSIISPVNGQTVQGTLTVTASAADNVGVAGVQFFVDGAPLGAGENTAP